MALVFPSSASIGQTYQSGSSPIYTYNGNVWTLSQGNVGIAALNSFSASLQQALQITGSNATMLGNLNVQGTQTALNQASLQISDKTIRIASGSTTSAQANGAGILIDGANVTMSWDSVNSLFKFGTQISASKFYGDGSGLTGVSSYTNSDNLSYLNSKGIISGSSQLTSSYDSRYVLSGSITQTTWNNIASKPSGIVSGSVQVLGGSGVISSSANLATTGSNTFIGTETISGSLLLSGSFNYNGTPLQNGFAFAQPTLTKIVNNASYTGAASWTGTYVGSGGAIIVRADVSGYRASGGSGTATLYRDSVAVASHTFYFNQINTHTAIPAITYVSNSETGSHTYSIGFSNIVADSQDYLTITVLEYGNSAMFPTTIISGSSQLTSSFDGRYLVTGSVTSSISQLNTFTASVSTASLVTSITNLNGATSSYETKGRSIVSGSSQLTSSFDGRYTQTGSFNTLSSSVDARLDTLELSIITGSANYIQVLGNRRTGITTTGVSIISASITTNGNPVQIMVTGDANPTTTAYTRLQIYRGETAIGNMVQVENSANLNVPYCVNVIDTPSAGTYIYSMRTVSTFSGTFDFGEAAGPVLTAVELNSNTTIRNTNNTFTGTNTFNDLVTLAASSGDEGGELLLAKSQTNNSLTGSGITIDSYQNRLRIFEQGGAARGVYVDLSKAPSGVAGELLWKASGIVNAGTFVTLDNIKATVTTTGNRGLSLAAVTSNFSTLIGGNYALNGGTNGSSGALSITTTASTSVFNWYFTGAGDISTYIITDTTNSRGYRIVLQIGASYNNNLIVIERLY